MPIRKIAIVGAGISGVMAAKILRDCGLEVRIFEKSRGCGGRMATRRASGYEFDHGAQYLTVRDEGFGKTVEAWVREAALEPWGGRFAIIKGEQATLESEKVVRYVGTPRMSSLVRHLAPGIDITFQTRITRLQRVNNCWQLNSAREQIPGVFDAVVLAIPPAQAVAILKSNQNPFPRLLEVSMLPCWAVMTAFERPLRLSFDAAFVKGSSLSWISRNSSKPRRPQRECWVLHGSPEWSRGHFDDDPALVTTSLISEFFRTTGHGVIEATWTSAHRWRYALAANPLLENCFWDPRNRLGVCGDWCQGSRIEGAFLSGKAIAERIGECIGIS
jgi:predicted NAD/FAD-dependent oxidoreductase